MNRTSISYVNLGSRWGIRVHPAGRHKPGDTVEVETRAGKIKSERLGSKHMSSGGTDYFNKATGPQTTSREEFDRDAAAGRFDTVDTTPATDRLAELRMRMLGQNVTFRRYQWEELLESLEPTSDLAIRVRRMLDTVAAEGFQR